MSHTAKANLLKEGIAESAICVTGNTVIDALLEVSSRTFAFDNDALNGIKGRMVLITAHRRESFGKPFADMCNAILVLARRYPEVTFVYPVHLNPNVRNTVFPILENVPNVILIEPLEYVPFVHLMKKACIILTDSGGIQEEAPSLGKPVLVMRDTTERPEGIEAGTVKLIGTDKDKIVNETVNLLPYSTEYEKMSRAINPYGDGKASERIVEILSRKI